MSHGKSIDLEEFVWQVLPTFLPPSNLYISFDKRIAIFGKIKLIKEFGVFFF
jgi:hypothetical protein